MTFEELGPLLRAEREKKGLSVDDVALHLKISGRVIRALEDGDEDSLPHNVYVRGFVRSYAGFLGFNDEELTAAMDAVNFDENPAAPQAVYTPINESPLSRKTLFVVFLALCIVAAGGYLYIQESDLLTGGIRSPEVLSTAKPAPPLYPPPIPPQDNADRAAKARQAQKNTPSAPPAVTPTAPQTTSQTPPQNGAQSGAQPTSGPANKNIPASPAAPASPSVPASPAQTGQNALSGQSAPVAPVTASGVPTTATAPKPGQQDTHKVIITALAECWIHSNADNTDTRQFSLRKGDTFALTFTNKLTLKLGNAGGVRIRYDGEDLPAPGTDGQVRTLTFPLQP